MSGLALSLVRSLLSCLQKLPLVVRGLIGRATPELQRLQAELGAHHSFREAARILETFLPCARRMLR